MGRGAASGLAAAGFTVFATGRSIDSADLPPSVVRIRCVGNTIYGIAKAATDKMSSDMAHELRPSGVTVVSLYPGLVRTESVMEAARGGWLDISNSESPEFIGRVIAALWGDPQLMGRSWRVVVAAELAQELNVRDALWLGAVQDAQRLVH